jgi:hypothetical protein
MKLTFGKHKGEQLEETPSAYILWLARHERVLAPDNRTFAKKAREIMEQAYQVGQIVNITKAIGPAVAKITAIEGETIKARLGGWNAQSKLFGYGGFAHSYTEDWVSPATQENIDQAAWYAGRHLSFLQKPQQGPTEPDADWRLLDEDGVYIA